MSSFLNYFLPALKFGAIFLSALSGSMGLLVDFKKDGRITKYGRIALLGVIISFIIAATTQAFEIYRGKQAAIAEEKKTQKMLFEISRGIYSIDASRVSFDFTAEVHANDKYFERYNARVFEAFKKYKENPKLKFSEGVEPQILVSEDGKTKEELIGFLIYPGSALYPNANTEKDVFEFIGKAALDVSIYKYDSSGDVITSNKKADLSFTTEIKNPVLEYRFYDTTITINAKELKSDMEDYAWRNQGGIESLLDLTNGTIKVSHSDRLIDNLNDAGVQLSRKYSIKGFDFNVSNRKFASSNLCRTGNEFPSYYLKLPENVLQTSLNIECGK